MQEFKNGFRIIIIQIITAIQIQLHIIGGETPSPTNVLRQTSFVSTKIQIMIPRFVPRTLDRISDSSPSTLRQMLRRADELFRILVRIFLWIMTARLVASKSFPRFGGEVLKAMDRRSGTYIIVCKPRRRDMFVVL